jgi:hypothetical protein
MIATKLCRSPWKVMSFKFARIAAGRSTVRPHECKSGPLPGAVNIKESAQPSTNSRRCSSSRRMIVRATGTERLERAVLGSLSKVTWPRTSTAVCTTWIRERKGSMSRRRNPALLPSAGLRTRRPAQARGYCRASRQPVVQLRSAIDSALASIVLLGAELRSPD